MTLRSIHLPNWLFHKKFILALFTTLAIIASLQSLLLGPKTYFEGGRSYPHYNNYIIFKQSFYHLIHHQDLYAPYPEEHWDFYKYTPTFALLFGALAILPDALGLNLWKLLNALILVLAIYYLPRLNDKQKALILLACAIESMTALQNEQSNGLMAGLLVLAYGLAERKQFLWAIACIVLSAFIKPYGIVGLSLFLFYPQKFKAAGYTLLSSLILLVLPLLVIPYTELVSQYQSWLRILAEDRAMKYGYSVAGWLHTWFKFDPNQNTITAFGILLFLLPWFKVSRYSIDRFRLLALCSVLIWIVIFNHMAESPTFIIAMTGASIWYFSKKASVPDTILFVAVFFFTSLSTTDIVPGEWQTNIFRPYVLKAVPCIILWFRILIEMLQVDKKQPDGVFSQPA